MSIETTMASYYAARAAEYDRLYRKPERQDDLQELARFVEDQFAGAHVFEVACGTGYWTEIVARAAASIVATDINVLGFKLRGANEQALTLPRCKSRPCLSWVRTLVAKDGQRAVSCRA